MIEEDLAKLPKEKLISLLGVCLRDLHTLDGLWFLYVEKVIGTERTIEIDRDVWARLGGIEAQRIKRGFNLPGEGLSLLCQALSLCPGFISFTEFTLKQISPKQAIFQVTTCYPQKARLRDGIGLFNCRPVDEAQLNSFAQALDPRIKVHCDFCPPEKYSENLWCQWKFYIPEEPAPEGSRLQEGGL